MKTLAVLGGMTPDVTQLYYRIINKHVREKLGRAHSARLYVYSVDLQMQLQRAQAGNWTAFAKEYLDALKPLLGTASPKSPSSVDGVLLGAILAHKVSPAIQESLPPQVQFLHAADFVAAALKAKDIKTAGIIGPAATMTDESPSFFRGKLLVDHGLRVLISDKQSEIDAINRGMMEEVAKGREAVTQDTVQMFRQAARSLIQRGAQALILGSTDLGFVLNQSDFEVPVLDVAEIHALGVAEWALGD